MRSGRRTTRASIIVRIWVISLTNKRKESSPGNTVCLLRLPIKEGGIQ
jgi:hypothetical protein